MQRFICIYSSLCLYITVSWSHIIFSVYQHIEEKKKIDTLWTVLTTESTKYVSWKFFVLRKIKQIIEMRIKTRKTSKLNWKTKIDWLKFGPFCFQLWKIMLNCTSESLLGVVWTVICRYPQEFDHFRGKATESCFYLFKRKGQNKSMTPSLSKLPPKHLVLITNLSENKGCSILVRGFSKQGPMGHGFIYASLAEPFTSQQKSAPGFHHHHKLCKRHCLKTVHEKLFSV